MENYNQLPNESFYEWKRRLCLAKLNKEIDLDWSEIVEVLGLTCSGDHLRKTAYGMKEEYDFAIANNLVVTDNEQLAELRQKEVDIKKERMKLSTEKSEYNKYLRNISRIELWEEKLDSAICQLEPIQVPPSNIYPLSDCTKLGRKVGITGFADLHFGKEFIVRGLDGEIINEYNEDVFKQRMWALQEELIHIVIKEELNEIKFFMLGDLLEGILRQSILQNLQYGVVDSTMILSEFLATWFNELSKYVALDIYTTVGNHSELRVLNSKSFEFPHENMERLIVHYIQSRLKDNRNVTVHDAKFMNLVNVLDLNILATHGQHEKDLSRSIDEYLRLYGRPIDMLLTGHLHNGKTQTIGINKLGKNIEYLQFPSLVGCDDYSMKLKKSSPAGSYFIVVSEFGRSRIKYDINLQNI